MSQTESQVTLELDDVQSESDEEPAVDEEQASLFGNSDEDSPTEDGTEGAGRSGKSRSSHSGKHGDGNGLEEFGVEEDPSPNNPRLDNPDGNLEADRRTNTRTSSEDTEQEALFPDIDDEDQMTLGGEQAYNQCLFE